MGLFSHKYNNKDFAKNSQIMSESIQRILMKIGGMPVGGAGKVLNQAMMQLQQMEYPQDARGRAVDGKAVAPIDERIFTMLDKIMADCQQGSAESIVVHANMLYSAIMHSRINGKEIHSKDFLALDEARADTLIQILEAYKKADVYNANMNKAVDRAKEVAPESDEYQAAKVDYMANKQQLDQVRSSLEALINQHGSLIEQINEMDWYREKQDLPKIIFSLRIPHQARRYFADYVEKYEEKIAPRIDPEPPAPSPRSSSSGKRDAFDELIEEMGAKKERQDEFDILLRK